MEFIEVLLQLLYKDRSITMSAAASQAYTDTLYQFHTWYTSAAFQLALKVKKPCFLQLHFVSNCGAQGREQGKLPITRQCRIDVPYICQQFLLYTNRIIANNDSFQLYAKEGLHLSISWLYYFTLFTTWL